MHLTRNGVIMSPHTRQQIRRRSFGPIGPADRRQVRERPLPLSTIFSPSVTMPRRWGWKSRSLPKECTPNNQPMLVGRRSEQSHKALEVRTGGNEARFPEKTRVGESHWSPTLSDGIPVSGTGRPSTGSSPEKSR